VHLQLHGAMKPAADNILNVLTGYRDQHWTL